MNDLIYMDAWHPAVNPSSRMPMHHLRYRDLFGDHVGILNEFPRKYGSSTIREMLIGSRGEISIVELNKKYKWMPWWIESNSQKALSIIHDIFSTAKNKVTDNHLVVAYNRFVCQYEDWCCKEKTMGEIAYEVNNRLFGEILPIPCPRLVSFNKSKILAPMSEALCDIGRYLYNILDSYLSITGKKETTMFAVFMDVDGNDWHVSYAYNEHRFVINSLDSPKVKRVSTVEELLDLFNNGKALPSALLSIIIEVYMCKMGQTLTHFGNTYGKIPIISGLLNANPRINYWADDADSWNYASFLGTNNVYYPIHLLDSYAYKELVREDIEWYLRKSYVSRKTEIIRFKDGYDFVECLHHRRA